jgi:hypothetical protein
LKSASLEPESKTQSRSVFRVGGDGTEPSLGGNYPAKFGRLVAGLALTWLLGSTSVRFLGIAACLVVCVTGLILAILSVRNDWETYRISAQDYDAAIADLREAAVKTREFDPDKFMVQRAKPQEQGPWTNYQKTPEVDEFARYKRKSPASTPPKKHVYDTSHLDTVEHPCLGTLKFPHDMPSEERNQLIEEAEKKSCKVVEIPVSVRKWERSAKPPEQDDEWEYYKVETRAFSNNATDEEIVSSIQSKELLSRPSFSVKVAIAKHLLSFSIGIGLTLLGSFGCGWLITRGREVN